MSDHKGQRSYAGWATTPFSLTRVRTSKDPMLEEACLMGAKVVPGISSVSAYGVLMNFAADAKQSRTAGVSYLLPATRAAGCTL